MSHFCLGLGLVISSTKTEVGDFNGPGTASSWWVGPQVLAQSASFNYLGLTFHESGTLSYALQRLAHNAVRACAKLRTKFRGLLCPKSFPMMRRLFDALVLSTHLYSFESWGPSCSRSLPRDIKKMADVQVAFCRQLCRLKRTVTPAIISGNYLKGHGCIGGGIRSLASCIACPTCLTTAFMLKFSGTTLLTPSNTLHVTTGLVALSSSTAVLAC